MINVLFVCLGNICRSPMAEGIFKKNILEGGFEDKIFCDSAGTSSYHIGELPDERMRATAQKHGIILNHLARQLSKEDFQKFNYIIAMDSKNYHNIKVEKDRLGAESSTQIFLMREFDPKKKSEDVPDPYFGGMDGFEEVYDIVKRSSLELLKFLTEEHNLHGAD